MEQRTPARKAPSKDAFDTRPAQVEAWIASLPLANLGESSRQIYQALQETNGLDVPADQRFRMLESLRAPLETTSEAMKKHFVGKQFPLPQKGRQIAELAQTLMYQVAQGYFIVVEDSFNKRGLLRDNKQITIACHRALTYLGLGLLRAYQVYAPYSNGIWQQIHRLYQFAESQGFARNAIKDEDGKSSCEDVYKRILMLALTCPYRLRQGEVEQIHDWMGEWTQYVTLEALSGAGNSTGLFVTNFESDEPPTYLVLRNLEGDCAHCRLVNATRLSDVMRDTLARQRRGDSPVRGINEHTLRRLMLAWGVMPKRRFSRSKKHSTASVAMGLSTAHFFISGESVLSGDSLFKAPAHFEASNTQSQQNEMPDMWDLAGIQPLRDKHLDIYGSQYIDFGNTGQEQATPTHPAPGLPTGFRTHDWKMLNVSAGGYCLLWDNNLSSQAQVGELVGLREADTNDMFHLSLGVVRWMKCDAGRGLELGVEMLAPGAVAVGTKTSKGKQSSEYMRSLLLPAIKAIGQPATLLTPALPYRVGDTVIVNSHGKEARVELTKLVENTGSFAQYQFRPLDSQAADTENAQAEAGEPDFNSLWDQL